jgi:hypothetical protein
LFSCRKNWIPQQQLLLKKKDEDVCLMNLSQAAGRAKCGAVRLKGSRAPVMKQLLSCSKQTAGEEVFFMDIPTAYRLKLFLFNIGFSSSRDGMPQTFLRWAGRRTPLQPRDPFKQISDPPGPL